LRARSGRGVRPTPCEDSVHRNGVRVRLLPCDETSEVSYVRVPGIRWYRIWAVPHAPSSIHCHTLPPVASSRSASTHILYWRIRGTRTWETSDVSSHGSRRTRTPLRCTLSSQGVGRTPRPDLARKSYVR